MSPPPGSAPRVAPGPPIFPNADQMFAGLLHFDGLDDMGRPVVIVNARAAAVSDITLRHLAVQYMMQRLDPLVYAVRMLPLNLRTPSPGPSLHLVLKAGISPELTR